MSVIRFFYDDEIDDTTAAHDLDGLTPMEKVDFLKDALCMLELLYNKELKKVFRSPKLKAVKK